MATSPREELRILTVTEFERSDKNDQWYWHTQTANGDIVGDGSEGYHNLEDAVSGFFAQQGFDPAAELAPEDRQYSRLYQTDDTHFSIRKYAYGAPEPYGDE